VTEQARPRANRRLLYVSLQGARAGSAAGTHVNAICRGLGSRGWQVRTVAPPHSGRVSVARRLIGWASVLLAGGRAAPGVSAIYVRSHPAALPLVLLARALRVPVVQEVNGPYADYFIAHPWLKRLGALVRVMIRFQLRRAASVVTVTEGLAEWVTTEAPGVRVIVIPNGVDVDRFHPDAVPRRALPARYAVFVGELTSWQGLSTVLAAAQSPPWPQEVSLVIAGDGQARSAVEHASRANPERIVYVGPVAHDEVPGLLAASLCAIVSSRDRAGTGVAPLKLFEAMAAGVPVVGTHVRDVARVVEEAGCGFVVPTEDAERLAAAVAEVEMDPQGAIAMGRRGRAAAVSIHSWNERAGRTNAVLETALKARCQRPMRADTASSR
jgi:glycosyltransferase involved in cell wall biosynthesis